MPDELRTLLDSITDERAGRFPYLLWLPAVHWEHRLFRRIHEMLDPGTP
ncbi:hypothetical protein [Nonomuraea basaltis]|nr:hypothetical protein [Nonomuraea basaltis]